MLAKITTKGKFCATRHLWETADSIVTYDNITFSETNMDDVRNPPLDIDTGIDTLNFSDMGMLTLVQEFSLYLKVELGGFGTVSGRVPTGIKEMSEPSTKTTTR